MARPTRQRLAQPDEVRLSTLYDAERVDAERLLYDYARINEEHRQTVQYAAVAIKDHVRRARESLIEIGKQLLAVKDFLPHGQWGAWLSTEFALSESMAQRMMRVAQVYGPNPSRVLDLPDGALYLLAAPSTPESAREAVERQMADEGRPLTRAEVETLIRRHRTDRRPASLSEAEHPPLPPRPREVNVQTLIRLHGLCSELIELLPAFAEMTGDPREALEVERTLRRFQTLLRDAFDAD